MKQLGIILTLAIGLMMLPQKGISQKANQGYYLAITPHANLYQKDSTQKVVPVKNQKSTSKESETSKKKAIYKAKKDRKKCSGVPPKRKKI